MEVTMELDANNPSRARTNIRLPVIAVCATAPVVVGGFGGPSDKTSLPPSTSAAAGPQSTARLTAPNAPPSAGATPSPQSSGQAGVQGSAGTSATPAAAGARASAGMQGGGQAGMTPVMSTAGSGGTMTVEPAP